MLGYEPEDRPDEFVLNEEGLFYRSEMELKDLDDANVPVDIWFEKIKKNDCDADLWQAGYRYTLRCGAYMPRKSSVYESACEVYAKEREKLQAAVEKYIVPFYKLALAKVTRMATEGKGSLYYWDDSKD